MKNVTFGGLSYDEDTGFKYFDVFTHFLLPAILRSRTCTDPQSFF